jgi:predicted protein tyrosine phosphatase
MSKWMIEKYNPNNPFVLISICCPDLEHPQINTLMCKDILPLKFHDIDVICKPYVHISEEQALKIIEFADKHENEHVVCQCEAGISRSAGVAAALNYIYNGDSGIIFNDKRYVPNRLVYTTIINTYYEFER